MKLAFQLLRPLLLLTASALAVVLLLAGCVGVRTEGEKRARQDQKSVGHVYRPGGERPALPKLDTNAPLHDFLLFAILSRIWNSKSTATESPATASASATCRMSSKSPLAA